MSHIIRSILKGFKVPEPYRSSIALHRIALASPLIARHIDRERWADLEKFIRRHRSDSPAAKPAYLLSIPNYTTGIGHSVMEMNTGYVRAARYGLRYLHLPIREPWESFFGFGVGELRHADIMREKPLVIGLPYLPFPDAPDVEKRLDSLIHGFCSERTVVFVLYPGTSVFAQSESASWLKSKYDARRLADPLPDLRKQGVLNVAIHVRRGDIMAMMKVDEGAWRERYIELNYYLDLARIVKKAAGCRALHFNIISEGDRNAFLSFDELGDVEYWLNYDVKTSMHAIARADIAILSPSSFSYLPALLGHGIRIIHSPFWHDIPQSPDWIRVETDPLEAHDAILADLRQSMRARGWIS